MEQNNKEISKKQGVFIGLGIFIVIMILLYTVCTWLQIKSGMLGVFLTELIFIVVAVGAVCLFKQRLTDVFSIRMPRLREIGGTIILWMGTQLITTISSILMGLLFPEGMGETNTAINTVINTVPLSLQILIIAVAPAICEEALHRGVILHFMKSLKTNWLIVLVMGVLFGLFHMSFYRFFPTAILGAVFTLVALETNNILLPMLFHFINNLPSAIASSLRNLSEASTLSYEQIYNVYTLKSVLLTYSLAPWLIFLGYYLIHDKQKPFRRRRGLVVSLIISVVMITIGICLKV